MKKLTIPLLFTAFVILSSFSVSERVDGVTPQEPLFEYDPDVMAIIENKCLGCHSPEGRSDKAKKALQWEKLPNMTKAEVIAGFEEVLEVLEEGSMPPAKLLEKYPDKALTKKETKAMSKWFDAKADELLGE